MSELIAFNLDQTLDLIKAYVERHNLSPEHVNEVFKIIYHVCSPGPQYKPHQVLYDKNLVQETLGKITLE
jgi:hypothetical protein